MLSEYKERKKENEKKMKSEKTYMISYYLVPFERFFYNFDYSVDLLNADHREASDVLGVRFALRNAT